MSGGLGETGGGLGQPAPHVDGNSLRAAAVVSAINVLMNLLLMIFLWWSMVPQLGRIAKHEEESILRDKAQVDAIDKALKTAIRNQEKNCKLLEEVIKANRLHPEVK